MQTQLGSSELAQTQTRRWDSGRAQARARTRETESTPVINTHTLQFKAIQLPQAHSSEKIEGYSELPRGVFLLSPPLFNVQPSEQGMGFDILKPRKDPTPIHFHKQDQPRTYAHRMLASPPDNLHTSSSTHLVSRLVDHVMV